MGNALMRVVFVVFTILLMSALAQAEEPLASIVLSPQEYQQIMSTLMQRDAIMGPLIAKEQQAQQAAKAEKSEQSKTEK